MDFVIGTFIRLLILAVLVVFEIAILFSIGKQGSRRKTTAAVIVPVLLLFCMFYQGIYRRPPIDKSDLIIIAKEIKQIGVENYPVGIYDDESTGLHVNIDYYITDETESGEVVSQSNPIEKLFSISGIEDGYEYYLSPMSSERPAEGFNMHQGYDGEICVKLGGSEELWFSYSIYRKVDEWFGFLFAAPVVKKYRLSEALNSDHLVKSYQYYVYGLYGSTLLNTLAPTNVSNRYTMEFELTNDTDFDLSNCKIICADSGITVESSSIDLSRIGRGTFTGTITLAISGEGLTLTEAYDRVAHQVCITLVGTYGDEGDYFEADINIF